MDTNFTTVLNEFDQEKVQAVLKIRMYEFLTHNKDIFKRLSKILSIKININFLCVFELE